MNTLFDCVCALARDKAARGGNHVRFRFDPEQGHLSKLFYSDNGDALRQAALAVIIDVGWNHHVAYPTGLILPAPRIPWLWDIPRETPRLGTAEQAWRYAQALNIDPERVIAIESDRVHGIHVREESRNGYRMIPSRPFPEWTR